MVWSGPSDAPPTARIAALGPSLQPSERRVAESLALDVDTAVERTAQEVADEVGVGRATVIRTAQSLGYDGYPQLRVALARELAMSSIQPDEPSDGSLVGTLRAAADRFGSRLGHLVSAVTEEQLQSFVAALDEADRVVVAANGLSAPLALDTVLRLTAAGRPAEYIPDALAQQIAARQLGSGSVCLVVSGSGANRASLSVMAAARESGATVLAMTSFARSAVVDLADVALVIPPVNDSFRDELLHTSRAGLMLITETLVGLVAARRGERGKDARSAVLSVVGRSLAD